MTDITELQARFPWGTKVRHRDNGRVSRVMGWSLDGYLITNLGAWHPDNLTVVPDLPELPAEMWGVLHSNGSIGTMASRVNAQHSVDHNPANRHLIVIRDGRVCDGETGEPLPIGGAE